MFGKGFFKRKEAYMLFLLLISITNTVSGQNNAPPVSFLYPDTNYSELNRGLNYNFPNTRPGNTLLHLKDRYTQQVNAHQQKPAILSLRKIAEIQIKSGQYSDALASLEKALALARKNQATEYFASIYNDLGNVCNYLSMFDIAVSHYLLALRYKNTYPSKSEDNFLLEYYIYNNLAFSFFELNNLDQAFLLLHKSWQAAVRTKDTLFLANSYNNLAGYYFRLNQWDSCAGAYHQVITLSTKKNTAGTLFKAYLGLGNLYDKIQQTDSALYYSLKAYALYQKGDADKNGYNHLLCNIGSIYQQKKNYVKAKQFYKLVETDSDKTPKEKALLLARQAELYAGLGRFDKAYQLKEAYHTLNDSLKSADIAVKISNLESKYELSQKREELLKSEALLNVQQLKTERRNLWLWIISLSAISLAIIAGVRYRQQQKRQKAEHTIISLKSRIEGEEKEKARIAHDLHDSVNSQLAAIKSFLAATEDKEPQLSQIHEFETAKDILSDTVIDVRNIAHNLAPDILLNDGLVEAINAFCYKLFATTSIAYHINTAGHFDGLSPELSLNIYRIIQELCNNIMKHADASTVTILLSNNDQLLHIVVEDDGRGIDKEILDNLRGIGIQSVKDRVHMFNGSVQIDSTLNSHTAFHINFYWK